MQSLTKLQPVAHRCTVSHLYKSNVVHMANCTNFLYRLQPVQNLHEYTQRIYMVKNIWKYTYKLGRPLDTTGKWKLPTLCIFFGRNLVFNVGFPEQICHINNVTLRGPPFIIMSENFAWKNIRKMGVEKNVIVTPKASSHLSDTSPAT